MAGTTVRNTTKGIRGLNAVGGYLELGPGEMREGVELSGDERKSAERTGYFEFGSAAKAEPEPEADPAAESLAAAGRNTPKLKKLAADEGIDVGEARSADELIAAITAGRAAAAAGGIPPIAPPPSDALDAMADDDLRNTVAVITGKPAPEGADREALLKLARGE